MDNYYFSYAVYGVVDYLKSAYPPAAAVVECGDRLEADFHTAPPGRGR